MVLGKDDIMNRWGFHPGTEITTPKHEKIRAAFIAFAKMLDEELGDCNAASVFRAFDKLQEASMWANFAIAELSPVMKPQGYTIANHDWKR